MFDSSLVGAIGFGLPETVALGAVALIGYLFGRSQTSQPVAENRPEEFIRAAEIAHQLETIADVLRRDLAAHHSQVEQFKLGIERASSDDQEKNWKQLSEQAELVLAPTLRLVGQVASAYDQIRKQSKALSNFTGGRTDNLTGLCNSRALHELLEMELGGNQATRGDFSLAVLSLSLDKEASHEMRQEQIVRAAEQIQTELRDNDLVARYGVEEFVIVMPNTRLFGASVFGRRLRKNLADKVRLTANSGLTQSMPGDTPKTLLSRADSALYSAKKAANEKLSNEKLSNEKGANDLDVDGNLASSHVPFDGQAIGLGKQFLHTGASIVPDGPADSDALVTESIPDEAILAFELADKAI